MISPACLLLPSFIFVIVFSSIFKVLFRRVQLQGIKLCELLIFLLILNKIRFSISRYHFSLLQVRLVTRFLIIVGWLFPLKIVTTTLLPATALLTAREPGGLINASIPTWMAAIFTGRTLRHGMVSSGITGRVTATPSNELRWKSNQLTPRRAISALPD